MVNIFSKLEDLYKIGRTSLIFLKILDKIFHCQFGENYIYACLKKMSPQEYETALQSLYHFVTGERLDLQNPRTFNQKIQWLKLYDSTALKTELTDKYAVRQWIADKIGENYLIPLYGVWNNIDEVDWESLPNQFVLKATHGSGWNVIVQDKSRFDWESVKKQFNNWMALDWAFMGLELQYKSISPQIIAEKFIETRGGTLVDYKIHCFNGYPEYIHVIGDREFDKHEAKEAFYNTRWELQPFITGTYFEYETEQKKPSSLVKMLEIAEKLCKEFLYVRVDLYELDNGDIKFGEMTFTPAAGFYKWSSEQGNIELGKKLKLPSRE